MDRVKILLDSLNNLSKSYQEQVEIFPSFVDVFDEVISDFDDAFQFLPTLMDEHEISYDAVKEILKCFNLIELNLTVEERKTDESFEHDEAWNLVRELASNAARLMNMKA